MQIVKESGEREVYSREKLCESLADSGAPQETVDKVCLAVEQELTPGISTSEIFRKALRLLVQQNSAAASRYNLKRGIAQLGPAGFFFEQFIETLLQALGYKTERNVIMQGKCVEHEVDVVAKKSGEHAFVEAKYHNATSIKTHVDVVMYADARLMDIADIREREESEKAKHVMWVITNTKFTSQAIKYASCRGLRLTGWKYPHKEGLEELVTRHALYPVTVLPSVNAETLSALARQNMMLAQDIAPHNAEELSQNFDIEKGRAAQLVREAHQLVYGEPEKMS